MVAPPTFNPLAVEIGSNYRSWCIERPIGSGGMGVVYRAQHLYTPRKSAIKIIRPPPGVRAEDGAVARFQVEAELHVTLRHPNLPDFYDADLLPDGTAILVLEWLDGYDLAKTLECLPRLTLGDALFVVADVLRPLTVLHPMGIHRDIKPSNIFICRRPRFDSEGRMEKGRVRLCDFGIAKLNNRRGPTREHKIIGTFNYMSPEQISGDPLDPRSDLYAVGALLYEMLAGRPVFAPPKNGDLRALYLKHLTEPPPDLRDELSEMPDDVWDFVARLLAKKPADRFATTVDALRVARDLRQRYCESSKIFREETLDVIALIDTLKDERWGLPPLPVSAVAAAGASAIPSAAEEPVATEPTPVPAVGTIPDPTSRSPISGVQPKLGATPQREAIAVGAPDTDRERYLDEPQQVPAPTQPSAVSEPTAALIASLAQTAPTSAKPPPTVKRGTFRISQGGERDSIPDWDQRIVDGIRQLIHAPRCFVRPALVRVRSGDSQAVEVIELTARSTAIGSSPGAQVLVDEVGLAASPLLIERLDDGRLILISRGDMSVAKVEGSPARERAALTHGATLEIGTSRFAVTDLAVWDPRTTAKVRPRSARARFVYAHIPTRKAITTIEIVGPLTLIGSSPACDLVISAIRVVPAVGANQQGFVVQGQF